MTVPEMNTVLKTVTNAVYETAAPRGATEYVVWSEYGSNCVCGDDKTILEVPKVQIDIIGQRKFSQLVAGVKSVLTENELPYEVISSGYDDEWASMRCILQVEVC